MNEMRLSQKQLYEILNHVADLALVIDQNGRYLEIFTSREDLLYRPASELIGKEFDEVLPEDKATQFKAVVREAIEQNRPISLDYELQTLGAMHWFCGTVCPLPSWQDGRPAVVLFALDITERKNREARYTLENERMKQAQREAEKALREQEILAMRSDRLRSMGEMAACMAHELNQPLSGIRGFAENVLISVQNGWEVTHEELIHKMNRIIQQTERMSNLINHVHDFSSDAERPVSMIVKASEVVKMALTMVSARFRAHSIDLKAFYQDEESVIRANPYSLEEVLLNILSNAYDALQEKAKTDYGSSKIVEVVVKRQLSDNDEDADNVVIEVRDTGVGMAPEQLQRAFEPFFTTKGPDRGAGLGLAVAKRTMDSLSGRLELLSKIGEGTTARLTFPRFSSTTQHNHDADSAEES